MNGGGKRKRNQTAHGDTNGNDKSDNEDGQETRNEKAKTNTTKTNRNNKEERHRLEPKYSRGTPHATRLARRHPTHGMIVEVITSPN